MLIRGFLPGVSHTLHSEELVFRSCGSHKYTQAKTVKALIDSGVLCDASLRNHCEGRNALAPWISLTDSIQWLMDKSPLRKKPCTTDDQRCVAFVNVEKLRRMDVIFHRSYLLAIQANIPLYLESNRTGVKFTSAKHWLVYDWIPPQCVERIISWRYLQELYAAHGMNGQPILYCITGADWQLISNQIPSLNAKRKGCLWIRVDPILLKTLPQTWEGKLWIEVWRKSE